MRRKKVLSVTLFLLLLLIGVSFLAYKFVLPILIQQAIEGGLKKSFKREVSLERVSFSLLKGVEVHRLFIPGKEKGKKAFLQVGELKIDYQIGQVFDNFRERGKEFEKWQLDLKVSSPEIIFQGFRLENFHFPLRVANSQLTGEGLRADLYGGVLKGSFSLGFGPDRRGYQLQGTLSDTDLSKLREGISSSKKKEVKGILEASFNLKGTAGNLKNLRGQGKVNIVEGKLWEFPLLGGLMAVLRLPSLEKITFREGKANFTVSKGIVATEDLTLVSNQVKLLAKGQVDFQGRFSPSLTYKVSFSKGFLDDVPLIGKILSSIIDEAGNLIAQVEVTGSLKEPKHRLIPFVKGIKDLLRIPKPSRGSD